MEPVAVPLQRINPNEIQLWRKLPNLSSFYKTVSQKNICVYCNADNDKEITVDIRKILSFLTVKLDIITKTTVFRYRQQGCKNVRRA